MRNRYVALVLLLSSVGAYANCPNLSGNWVGTCKAEGDPKTFESKFKLEHSDCKQMSINGEALEIAKDYTTSTVVENESFTATSRMDWKEEKALLVSFKLSSKDKDSSKPLYDIQKTSELTLEGEKLVERAVDVETKYGEGNPVVTKRNVTCEFAKSFDATDESSAEDNWRRYPYYYPYRHYYRPYYYPYYPYYRPYYRPHYRPYWWWVRPADQE